VIWLLLEANGGSQNVLVLLKFGAKYGPAVAAGEYWRLLTAVFIHIGLFHLIANTIGLLIFGGMVERAYGMGAFLAIYLLAGVFGNLASYAAGPTVSAGASGAVFGIVGAFGAYLLVNRRVLGDLARRSLWGLVVIVAINIGFGLSVGGVDNWAHLGGLLSGGILGIGLAPRLVLVQVPLFSLEPAPAPVAGRHAPLLRWQGVVLTAIAVLAITTWFVGRDYPYTASGLRTATASEAEDAIQRGDFGPARELVGVMADGSRGGTRIGLLYLQRGFQMAQEGNRGSAAADIRSALAYRLPEDAVSLANAALARLGARP
jgi:rhomboid protease GluP